MGGGNGAKAAQKRERNAKAAAKKGPTSQLKQNEKALTIQCMTCRQTFLQTSKAPALTTHAADKHKKVRVPLLPHISGTRQLADPAPSHDRRSRSASPCLRPRPVHGSGACAPRRAFRPRRCRGNQPSIRARSCRTEQNRTDTPPPLSVMLRNSLASWLTEPAWVASMDQWSSPLLRLYRVSASGSSSVVRTGCVRYARAAHSAWGAMPRVRGKQGGTVLASVLLDTLHAEPPHSCPKLYYRRCRALAWRGGSRCWMEVGA